MPEPAIYINTVANITINNGIVKTYKMLSDPNLYLMTIDSCSTCLVTDPNDKRTKYV